MDQVLLLCAVREAVQMNEYWGGALIVQGVSGKPIAIPKSWMRQPEWKEGVTVLADTSDYNDELWDKEDDVVDAIMDDILHNEDYHVR